MTISRSYIQIGIMAVFCFILGPVKGLAETSPFDPQKASYSVRVMGHVSPYRFMSFFVLPEEKILIEILPDLLKKNFAVSGTTGRLKQVSAKSWQWQAPVKTGHYEINIEAVDSNDKITLLFFVQVPYGSIKGKKYLNGYRIGTYPSIPLKQLPIYRPPRGFVEVTPENMNMKVSPHFQLYQFLCKQKDGFPKYLVIRTKLLLKLELVLEQVNDHGYRCDSFNVLSGYRTPYYNKAIGNVKYSRHQWGGAADIFIDETPKDNYMDDLNKDGVINWRDAEIIYNIIDNNYGKSFYEAYIGGLGRYRKTPAHPPFVHVDVRGNRARWGD